MKIFKLEIPALNYADFFKKITQLKKQNIVFTPNPEICLKTLDDKEFLRLLQKADYLTSDGIGLYIAYQIENLQVENFFLQVFLNLILLPYYFFNLIFRRKMLYEKYGERICGSDLTIDLTKFAEKNDIHISIIDLYNPTDLAKVANQKVFWPRLQKYFPGLQFDYHIYNPADIKNIIKHISESDSQILFSTLGMKSQEQSVIEIMQKCQNIKLGLWIGSSFDYMTGFQKRAPDIMRQMWLEWLYRIFTSPNKLQRLIRIYKAVVVFSLYVVFKRDSR